MTREKLLDLSKKLTSDKENYLTSFHKNMNLYVSQPDMTIREISERSGLSFSTINTVLYGNNRDYKLSTIIGLSKAMNVSIDELVGCSTLNDDERYLIQQYRSSNPRVQLLIRWFISLQTKFINDSSASALSESAITVMKLYSDADGSIIPSNQFSYHTFPDLEPGLINRILLGIQLPCCDYMPYYSPYDLILIANDRLPRINEDCVIISCGRLYIAKRVHSGNSSDAEYVQINSGKLLTPSMQDIMGYICDVKIDESFYQR